MILLDTSLLIDVTRNPDGHLARSIPPQELGVIGLVGIEFLQSSRDDAHDRKLEGVLDGFLQVPMGEPIWREAARNASQLRRVGITVTIADICIATLAIRLGVPVWSLDKDFLCIHRHIPQLRLYEHPSKATP